MSNFVLRRFIFFLFILTPLISWADNIVVSDYRDNSITLEKPAQRIISLAPHITENIYSAGAGDLIVGVIAYSDFPIEAKQHPQVGSAYGVSVEKILSLSPDLIIAWSSGTSQKTLSSLAAFDIPIYYDEPKTLEDIAKSINDIGQLTGRIVESQTIVNQYLNDLTILREQYSSLAPVSVFYQIWNDPIMTLSGEHIVTDVMHLCGGHNIFADAAIIAPKISIESVLVRNPDTIIASGEGSDLPDSLIAWRQWPELRAVKNNHLFLMPPDILQRHSVRLLQAAGILCEHFDNIRKAK